MSNILEDIVASKLTEVSQAKSKVPVEQLAEALADAAPVRDFVASMQSHGPVAMIAEVKKASPSAGVIREDFHPVEIARI